MKKIKFKKPKLEDVIEFLIGIGCIIFSLLAMFPITMYYLYLTYNLMLFIKELDISDINSFFNIYGIGSICLLILILFAVISFSFAIGEELRKKIIKQLIKNKEKKNGKQTTIEDFADDDTDISYKGKDYLMQMIKDYGAFKK